MGRVLNIMGDPLKKGQPTAWPKFLTVSPSTSTYKISLSRVIDRQQKYLYQGY